MICGAGEEDYEYLLRRTKQEQWRIDFTIALEAPLTKLEGGFAPTRLWNHSPSQYYR
jgi:hypothetical protein